MKKIDKLKIVNSILKFPWVFGTYYAHGPLSNKEDGFVVKGKTLKEFLEEDENFYNSLLKSMVLDDINTKRLDNGCFELSTLSGSITFLPKEKLKPVWMKKFGDIHIMGKNLTLCGMPMLGNNYRENLEGREYCEKCKKKII